MKCPTRYCTGYCVEQLFEEQPWGDLEITQHDTLVGSRNTAVYNWTYSHRNYVNALARKNYHRRKHEKAQAV